MKVYLVSIVLLTNEYFSYAQEKQIDKLVSEVAFNNALRSQSRLVAGKEDNYRNNIDNTLQEATQYVTENYVENNKQIINTRNSKEDKIRKNTIRIFDIDSKQYITVDLAKLSEAQTDITTNDTETETFHIEVDSKTPNVDEANNSKNTTVYITSDSQTQTVPLSNNTGVQRVDKTKDIENKPLFTVNGSRILTINNADDPKIETVYLGNDSETQNLSTTGDYKNKIAKSQIQTANTTNDSKTKTVEIARNNNRNRSSIESNLIDHHGTNRNCKQLIRNICTHIESSRRVRCSDGTTIPLNRLCNGYTDCTNRSDEENCVQQAGEKVQLATNILLDAQISNECLPQIEEDNSFLEQLKSWQNILKTGWQYKNVNIKGYVRMISTIFDSLETHLCRSIELYDMVKEDFSKIEADFELFIDNSEKLNNLDWSPSSCTCNHQFCKLDYCDSRCRRICWQINVLDHYGCQSVTGATTIPLDYICDGKIDCMDETDETSCMKESSAYKHKANTIYDTLLKTLLSTEVSQKYDRNKIKKLTDLVSHLQTLTTKTPNPDINTIKILRHKYFKLLVKIFKKLWLTVSVMRELNYAHDFLLSLNQNMVKALKSSYTGNKYVLSSAECFCKDGVCASVVCSRKCIEFCLAEPVLTKYKCNANDTFVSTEAICDGNKDCLNGEDEKDCKHEVCRARQLDKLRLTLIEAEKLLKDIVFDKVLEVWKAKIAQITIIPENEEPNRTTLQDKVRLILSELLVAYSSMAQTSKTNRLDINGFLSVSNIVKQILKSCSK